LLPLLVLAACGEDQPSTAPPVASDGPAFGHTATHKVVNSSADPGDGTCNAAQCTLREAIEDPSSTQITFASGFTGPITLARPTAGGGTLVIDKNLSITGPSAKIVIQRRSTDPAFRIFRIGEATATLRNLIIRNGQADQGGGIINFGTLSLINSTVATNSTSGIDNHGPLTLTNSVVSRNSSHGIDNHNNRRVIVRNSTVANNSGAGIVNRGGALELTNSAVTGNLVGGIAQDRGTSTITNARIAGNSTPLEGGGIAVGHGEVTLTNSTVSGNSAQRVGGGINTQDGTFTIIKSTISGNSSSEAGGGIHNEADLFCRLDASLTVINSTVSGNSAPFGGGIVNTGCGQASTVVTNSTVVRNSATSRGGGIFEGSDEGGITLRNSLVAQNRAPTGPDVFSSRGSVGARFSLIGDGRGSGITNTNGNQVGNVSPNSSPIDPRLGPLNNNGGPTRTHALLSGSPAIDAASMTNCPATDQRGVPRPQRSGCDIGSYELR
jgi:CSLREA domain-containing protein